MILFASCAEPPNLNARALDADSTKSAPLRRLLEKVGVQVRALLPRLF
jgi:hypothetical protein